MHRDLIKYKFIDRIANLPFVDEIWLFGSRARGDNQERSDIDLAILCPKASDYDWTKVMDVIENADTLLKIDCVRLQKDQISDELYNNILKDKKVLYAKS
jgi:uncharacterized protein